MRLGISGLDELRRRLAGLRIEEVMAQALAEQAEILAAQVREGLSGAAGAGDHDRPWLRSGALRDSVGAQADGLEAAVGSSDPAAGPQEMGTVRLPPRPFLAPVAASQSEAVAQAIAARVAAALRGDGADPNIVQASSGVADIAEGLVAGALIAGVLALVGRPQHEPGRAPPMMHEVPEEEGREQEGTVGAPIKPAYKPNAAHNPRSPSYNPNKDPEPDDAEEVYQNAERDPKPERWRRWIGRNSNGRWYQYYDDNAGSAHYAGTIGEDRVPASIRRRSK